MEIHVHGEINNTGELTNNGIVSFTGDWTNLGNYKGEGLVEAGGQGSQKIAHHSQTITRLSVSGGSTKYISGKVVRDSYIVTMGLSTLSWSAGFSYDATTSTLERNFQGASAFEISFAYRIKILKAMKKFSTPLL